MALFFKRGVGARNQEVRAKWKLRLRRYFLKSSCLNQDLFAALTITQKENSKTKEFAS
jgi:hypothetical protein